MKPKRLLILFSFILLWVTFASAEETLTITTYYPSPYGVYNELRSTKIAIGDTYIQGSDFCWTGTCPTSGLIDPSADLVVEGNVGIGTVKPITTSALTIFRDYPDFGDPTTILSRNPFPGQLVLQNSGNRLYLGTYWAMGAYAGAAIQAAGYWGGADHFPPDNYSYLSLNPKGGNVGIGTMQPGASLHILKTFSSGIETGLLLENSDTIASYISPAILFKAAGPAGPSSANKQVKINSYLGTLQVRTTSDNWTTQRAPLKVSSNLVDVDGDVNVSGCYKVNGACTSGSIVGFCTAPGNDGTCKCNAGEKYMVCAGESSGNKCFVDNQGTVDVRGRVIHYDFIGGDCQFVCFK